MIPVRPLERSVRSLDVDGARVEIATLSRPGTGTPLVFLHGFGSTKEDYVDVIHQPRLASRPILAYDAPGCGASTAGDYRAVDIPFLVAVADAMLTDAGFAQVHLVGHSMGGLTALRLATQSLQRVASFIDIEGNLAPEDCFLSRQILDHRRDSPEEFFADFRARVSASRFAASALYAAALPAKVRPEVIEPIFTSMVDLSDNAPLLEDFLALPFPRMLMYGEQNSGLSYLSTLAEHGVRLAEIPHSGHFPMYSNAPAMWSAIDEFLIDVER